MPPRRRRSAAIEESFQAARHRCPGNGGQPSAAPPRDRQGVSGFLTIISAVAKAWDTEKASIEKSANVKFTYIPFRGGGEVAVQLVGKHVDMTVNNPIEAVAQWRAGKVRPLCVFDSKPLAGKEKIAGDLSWSSIPTCKSQGLDIEYLMLRGIFMPANAPKDAVDYYVELFKKVRATPEWAQLMADGAFNQSFMSGADYTKWVEAEEKRHRDLMKEAGFLATN